MTRILIISHDVVDQRMAGPGIRYWELARVLAREFHVTLAAPEPTSLSNDDFEILTYPTDQPQSSLAEVTRNADVVLAYGYAVGQMPFLTSTTTPWIADVYVPEPTETLAWQVESSEAKRQQTYLGVRQALRPLALRADLLICANDRQRDFWLGVLAAYGRLNPSAWSRDPSLRCLVDIVPFGIPSDPPIHRRPVLKGVWPGIGVDDQVILWGGGLWDWFDPLTLLRAMAQVVQIQPKTRLVFPGTRHPNVKQVPDMAMRRRVEALTRDLNLEAHVFAGDWLPYEDRENYLLESDIGVSLHFDTAETRFAFRTRILDYIWAGLPMVVTHGDSMSDTVSRYRLGEVVPPDDHERVAAALLRLLEQTYLRDAYKDRFKPIRSELSWERAVEPIVRFCKTHSLALDSPAHTPPAMVNAFPEQASQLTAEVESLRRVVAAYENGRFMRFMRRIHSWRMKAGM